MSTVEDAGVRRIHVIELAPKTIVTVLGILAGLWLLSSLTTVLSVVVVALVLVGTVDPVVAWLKRRGLGRGKALVLVFVVGALLLIGVVLLMVPPLISQVAVLLENAPKARDELVRNLAGHGWAKSLIGTINDFPIDTLSQRATNAMLGYSTTLVEGIGFAVSALFLAIYLLADPTQSKGFAYALVPRRFHIKLARILLELTVIVGGYMRGQLITSVCIGVFTFVLLTVLGAQNALAIALFAGMTDIIPFVGGYIATAPVVIAVAPRGATIAIVIFGVMMLYQEFESRILVPRVYGKVLRLPPAIVLVALLVGGTLAGIFGALLALPIAAGLQMVIRELRVELPGESHSETGAAALDRRANVAYEQMSEGATAAEAGEIADSMAATVMQNEHDAAAMRANGL